MKRLVRLACFALMAVAWAMTAPAAETPPLPIERQVAAAIKGSRVTVVHFWAPWCPNCKAELAGGGWSGFIAAHPDVDFIFVTAWNPTDGHELLASNGVGAEKNFTLLLHPNGSRKRADKMTAFLDLPVSWIPTTWIFKDGRLRYALNYGELRFPMLGQLIADASDKWAH
jgi:thiol-disulfide isomerase/thioredoxin